MDSTMLTPIRLAIEHTNGKSSGVDRGVSRHSASGELSMAVAMWLWQANSASR